MKWFNDSKGFEQGLQQRALKNLRVAMLREAIDPITEGSKETIKLVNLQPCVYKLLDTSGLAGSFEMLDSMEVGLNSFES